MNSTPRKTAPDAEEVEGDAKRISKRDLVRRVARRAGVTIPVADRVYESLLVEIIDQVRNDVQVNLSGYGRFYAQIHKGHHAQFGATGHGRLPDYAVLKFSASRKLSGFLALDRKTAQDTRVPGTVLHLGSGRESADEDLAETDCA